MIIAVLCMGIGSTEECSFTTLALCFSLFAHPINLAGTYTNIPHHNHMLIIIPHNYWNLTRFRRWYLSTKFVMFHCIGP